MHDNAVIADTWGGVRGRKMLISLYTCTLRVSLLLSFVTDDCLFHPSLLATTPSLNFLAQNLESGFNGSTATNSD
jgi:hypothetical protein